MNLRKLILTENACYKAGRKITPKGIMVHSTGANNPYLRRYVGPDDGQLGVNEYNNHWNQDRPGGRQVCVHAFIGKLKHISNITECSMQFIRDEDIKTAFVTMMNKLIYGQKFILRPLLNGLRNQNNVASFRRIEELETKIENNMEQSQMLTGLMAKGYLEPALFNKEKNSLEAERERLLVEKDQLTRSVNGNFTKVEEVDRLLKFATKSQMLTAYEDELFENYVEKIMVFSREEVGFELKCGITLKERLVN